MRSIIFWLALILWLLLGYFFYTSSQECCTTKVAESAAVPVVTKITNKTGPLMFNWSDSTAITGDGWDAMRTRLIDGLKDNQVLEIVGHYRSDETNNTTFANLGLARANAAAQLLMPPLTEDRIRLTGKLVDDKVNRDEPFESTAFFNRINTASIKEIADRTVIYFPFNSTNKLNDREVEAYLDDVADRVKKSGEKIRLTGHTDNVGEDESNIRLGQRRANIIKNYLLSKGVPSARIVATSKGESRPIASNDSEPGRAKNRRTELQIIK